MSKIEEALLEYEKQDYKKAYILFNEYRKESSEKDFDRYYSYKFIKTIYEVKIKHMKNLDADIQKDIIYIIKHSDFNAFFYKITIFKTVELLENKNNVNWKDILIWLKKLDLNSLSSKKNIFEIEGKKIEMFSEIEKYFLKLTKAYEKIKDYNNLYLSCQEALKEIKEFTNGSDIWIKRRMAICYVEKKDYEKAINLYKEILIQKKDWYLYREIGSLYERIGEKNEAILNYFEAFIKANDLSKVSKLLYQIYNALNKDLETKRKFYLLILSLNNKKYKDLITKTEEEKIILKIDKKDIKELNSEKYFWKLKKEIKELKLSYQDRKKGFIATINEKYCFIESDGNRYFCQIKEFPKNLNLVKGLNVEFTLVESFDKKKNKLSYAAKDIKILEENNID